MTVVDITSKAQFDTLREETPFVALQAHATWCGPCKLISPIFNQQAKAKTEQTSAFAFARFDIDDIPELAEELGIRSIPAFFFFESGKKEVASELTGAKPQPLIKLINTYADLAKDAPAPEQKQPAAVLAANDGDASNKDPDAITPATSAPPAFSTTEDF